MVCFLLTKYFRALLDQKHRSYPTHEDRDPLLNENWDPVLNLVHFQDIYRTIGASFIYCYAIYSQLAMVNIWIRVYSTYSFTTWKVWKLSQSGNVEHIIVMRTGPLSWDMVLDWHNKKRLIRFLMCLIGLFPIIMIYGVPFLWWRA